MAKWWFSILFILFFFCQGISFAAEEEGTYQPTTSQIATACGQLSAGQNTGQSHSPAEGWLPGARHLSASPTATARTFVKRCPRHHGGAAGFAPSTSWTSIIPLPAAEYILPHGRDWTKARQYYIYGLRRILI